MISPIIAAQNSAPIANIQHNTEAHSAIQTTNAQAQVKEEERQAYETVIKKDEAVFYEQHHDAREEGRNKYVNLYNNKKKKKSDDKDDKGEQPVTRVNFDLKI